VRNNIKSVFLVFSIVAAGGVVYGLARGHGIGETLIATVMAGSRSGRTLGSSGNSLWASDRRKVLGVTPR
jgi:hypothetical protein